MDSSNNPTTPQPNGSRLDPIDPPIELDGYYQDQLGNTLSRLENSIEEPARRADIIYSDNLSRLLDATEIATEHQVSTLMGFRDPLATWLDECERLTEQSGQPKQRMDAGNPINDKSASTGSPGSVGRVSAADPKPIANPMYPRGNDPKGAAFSRSYPEPQYHPLGHSTGVRNVSPRTESTLNLGFDQYCELHTKWVLASNCPSCPDFEKSDQSDSDQDENHCRHGFFRQPVDGNETRNENTDSSAPEGKSE